MARTRKGSLPKYPETAHNGQARITVRLTSGRRHDLYLGSFDSSESRAEYRRVLALLESNSGCYPVSSSGVGVASGLTVNEIALAFGHYACDYYRRADGSPSGELGHYQAALNPLLDLYGDTLGSEFRPHDFKVVRERLVRTTQYHVCFTNLPHCQRWLDEQCVRLNDRLAYNVNEWQPFELIRAQPRLSRKVINQRMDHIKRVFRWAASEELVPATVYDALKVVGGLRRGHKGTREMPKVHPVPDGDFDKTLPYLSPQVRALVQLQLYIGARPSEICSIRGRNIVERDEEVWQYRIDPGEIEKFDYAGRQLTNLHKTGHQDGADGHPIVKILPIGPRAQEILKPWLRADLDEFLFQPREVVNKHRAARRKNKTKALSDLKNLNPKYDLSGHYSSSSYRRAVTRAAKKAGVPHWHPHQLKHNCATNIRAKYGAENSQIYMGHLKLSSTEIYAERDWKKIKEIALEIG